MLSWIKNRLGFQIQGLADGPKIDFLICGAQKSGTSALNKYLAAHRSICMADKKEVHYFDRDEFFTGEPDYQEYHSFFSQNTQGKQLGEATPIYMYWEQAPRRIWEYNPKMKIIMVLRNPIDRAYSHWNMERSKGREDLSFLEGVYAEEGRCRDSSPLQDRKYSYVDRGFYTNQLKRMLQYFPREQVLVLKYDDFKKQPDDLLRKICIFLNIRPFNKCKKETVHARPYISKMTTDERKRLINIYTNEIRELEGLLGWDCAEWLDLEKM